MRSLHEALEPDHVHVARVRDEHVTRRAVLDPLGAQRPPQVTDIGLQGVPGSCRRFRPPQRVRETIDRDNPVGLQEEEREQRPLLRPADRYRPIARTNFQRPEKPKVHELTVGRAGTRLKTQLEAFQRPSSASYPESSDACGQCGARDIGCGTRPPARSCTPCGRRTAPGREDRRSAPTGRCSSSRDPPGPRQRPRRRHRADRAGGQLGPRSEEHVVRSDRPASGRRLVPDPIAVVVDIGSGNEVLTPEGHSAPVNDIAWSPDGASMAWTRTVATSPSPAVRGSPAQRSSSTG
jgi:hypothetical protein